MKTGMRNFLIILITAAVLSATVWGCLYYEKKLYPNSSESNAFSQISFSLDPDDPLRTVSPWFNEKDGIYYVFLPSGAEPSSISVPLKSNQALVIEGNTFEDGDKLSGVEIGVQLSAKLSIGGEQEKAKLMFMKSDNVSSMFITTASGNMRRIHADKLYSEAGRISLDDASGKNDYSGYIDKIHGRGNTTWNYSDKKTYYFRLSENAGLLGMNPGQTWVLLANHFDSLLIRNKLVYDFAREHGVNYAVDSRFVDLYLNGEYVGLYQLCEKIDVGKNRVDIYNLDSENQKVNSGFPKGAGVVSYPLGASGKNASACQALNNPYDISGGYLFEFFGDLAAPSIFYTDSIRPISIISPEYASTEQVNYLYSYVQAFEDAITDQNGVNSETKKHYTEYIDLDSFVLDYLVNEVFLNYDGGMRSWFMYKLPSSQGGLIYSGPVWDFDSALGGVKGKSNAATFYVNRESQTDDLSFGSWYYELYKKPDFYAAAVKTYKEVFLPYIENTFNYTVDALTEEIYQSAEMNYIRWFGSENFDSYFSINIEEIKSFLSERKNFLNSAWLDGKEYLTVRIDTNNNYKDTFFSVLPGEVFTEFPEPVSEGNTFDGWYYYGMDEKVNTENGLSVTQDIYIYAKWIPKDLTSDEVQMSGIKKFISAVFTRLDLLVFFVAAAFIALLLVFALVRRRKGRCKGIK